MTYSLVVTGVDGFVGRHLARIAAASGAQVFGISRSPSIDSELAETLTGYVSADLREAWPDDAPRDAPIIHLAGLAAVGASFDRPQDYIAGNSAMVTNMCEALIAAGAEGRIVGVSTGAVYAQREDDVPRAERDPVAYTSPYVVSKILVENQLAYYSRRGLRTVIARPFNHIGPRQGRGFLLPDLLEKMRTTRPGHAIRVGNLDTRRDYTDVRDVARAYIALATHPHVEHDVYNVASGTSRSGREILDALTAATGGQTRSTEVDPALIRATDPPIIVGDATRLRDDTGWVPEVPFDTTVADAVAAAL